MTPLSRLRFALLACACALALPARAQEAPKSVEVTARRNPGDLRYEYFFRDQGRLYGFLPHEPRAVDVLWRISFRELGEAEQDAYVPQGWAVALVEGGFEKTVPVARGGYFLLPALPYGRRGATIMFKEQSQPSFLGVAWVVRVSADQRLAYADFGKALDQVHSAQNAIPLDYEPARQVRTVPYDGLKACFTAADGALLIDGKPAADARVGDCTVLKFDPAKAGAGQVIEFKGPLQVVTVVSTRSYLNPES